jgi:antitoxin (DNA-binding transcriptional repressor) of toxin-antitoxin stability system
MQRLTATEAARGFADVLDAVERSGETFLVVRRGRAVARIEPAVSGHGRMVKDLLRSAPRDPAWVEHVRRVRAAAQVDDRRWNG